MNKRELLKALEPFDEEEMIVLSDSSGGWCNIDSVKKDGIIHIKMEEYSIVKDDPYDMFNITSDDMFDI